MPVSTEALGQDEIEAEHRADFAWWRQAPRSGGYMARMKGWEDRAGGVVVPYDR